MGERVAGGPVGWEDVRLPATAALVRQKHDYGCGVACLAMVMGTTYEVIHERLLNEWVGDTQTREWLTDRGLHDGIIQWFLARNQRVWQQVFAGWKWEPWPAEPFAPIHIAQVKQPSGNTHYVVMLSDGTVLDPLSDEPTTLAAWEKVNNVTGIWHEPAAPTGVRPDATTEVDDA